MTPETPREPAVYKHSSKARRRSPRAAEIAGIAFFSWAIAGGCTGSRPPPKEAPPVEVKAPSAEAPVTTTTPDPPRTKEPIDVVLPADPACTLTGDWHPRKYDTQLHVSADGPSFAELLGGTGALHFPTGPRPATQGLELAADGIVVRGFVDSAASLLLAGAPIWLSGLAVTQPYALLDWTEATPGHLAITSVAPRQLEVLAPPLTATVGCADVALGKTKFDPTASIPGYAKAKERLLPRTHAVDIALSPGGTVVARANAGEYAEQVSLLETKGAAAKIAWPVGALVVVGWVKASELIVPKAGMGFGSGSGRLGGSHHTHSSRQVVCAADIDLLAEYPGETTYTIGRVRAGTRIEINSTGDRFTMVSVSSQNIRQISTAWWVVRNRDLEGCQSPPK
ncbi:MAG: hypothetical protein U0441_32505 [Polyangiaceae bacterium]